MSGDMAALFETDHDAVVGRNVVAVVLVLAGLHEGGFAIAVVVKNDLLVSTARTDRKALHDVGVDLSDGLDSDVDFFGGGVSELAGDVVGNGSRRGNFWGVLERTPWRNCAM